jgi:hypothetical protein
MITTTAITGTFSVASEPTVIQVGLLESAVGLAAIVLAAGVAWGTLKTKVGQLDKDVAEIKQDTKKFAKDMAVVKTIVQKEAQDGYAVANSPRRLTERGANLLENSGIKELIDANRADILVEIKQKAPKTAYDAEICVMNVIENFFRNNEALNNALKEKTFALGENIEIVYFVGGIYFRDIALPEIGFKINDIDKSTDKKS